MPAEINFNLPGNKKSEHNSRDKIAVVYARYSSHSQTEQSIEGQLAAAQTYAAAHDYTIVHEYIDRAKSGRTDSREQFQAMLQTRRRSSSALSSSGRWTASVGTVKS